MLNNGMWLIEIKNASVVCPLRVRPEASVMVPEIMMGNSKPTDWIEHAITYELDNLEDTALDNFDVEYKDQIVSDVVERLT